MFLCVLGNPAAALTVAFTPEDRHSNAVSELKRTYITCEFDTSRGRLDGADIAVCSVVYEDLKRLEFNGSFQAIRAWTEAAETLGLLSAQDVHILKLP